MRRNWVVIRTLLEHFEKEDILDYLKEEENRFQYDSTRTEDENKKAEAEAGFAADQTFGHLLLLMDAELVEGVVSLVPTMTGWHYTMRNPRLTMKGHDTLDAIRSDTVWNEVKKRAADAALPVTLELILAVLRRLSLMA